jgi:excisionase family DNA binding protein
MPALTDERLLTSFDVARIASVSLETVQHWARTGRLRAIRVGRKGRYRFPESEIRRLIANGDDEEAAA